MSTRRFVRFLALTLPLVAPVVARAATGSIAGAFAVSGVLPENASFKALLSKTGEATPVASQEVSVREGALPFSFPGLGPGVYRARLVALRDGRELALATTAEVELSAAAPSREAVTAPAPGKDGAITGTLKTTGSAPKGKLVFVSARRVDITHKSFMPDGVNNASFEISEEELQAGQVKYTFAGLSYGLFKVQLMSYDYNTHATASHGERAGAEILVDLDHKAHERQDFTGSFAPKP